MKEARRISLPTDRETVTSLNAGDYVLISGLIVTGRDRVHKHLYNEKPPKESIPFELEGSVIYHCGPIIVKDDNGEYRVISGGPTTSSRMGMYEPWVIENYGLAGVMGKGGMDDRTLNALKKFGCVYLNAVSGAGALLAERIKRVAGVWMLEEFGAPEAMWQLEVEDFPALVTMDAHGRSLHRDVEERSKEALRKLLSG